MSARELDALAAASNHLLNLHRKLTKVQRPVTGIPQFSPVPMRLDDRFAAGVLTRGKKSTAPPEAVDRFTSEIYPIAPPRVDFYSGTNTRLIGRDPTVTWR